MALIDSDAGEIVIRVVYDGPPEAGKTTSLRALAGSLVQPTHTPAEDAAGRTLWFDWMEYIGGRFEGCQIRCQIVSVPGQRALGARRRRILQDADVVVFVADSATAALPTTLGYLTELRAHLASAGDSVGVIVQANKRDLPDAMKLDAMRDALAAAGWPLGIVESVAADGTGIREAFVYAVRLALDRVRDLMSRGAMPAGVAAASNELLAALHAEDDARHATTVHVETGPASLAAALLREVVAVETKPPEAKVSDAVSDAPAPPDTSVPSGAVWPPVEGRALLAELAHAELVPRRLAGGDWAAGLGSGWRVVSGRDATFESLDAGRTALIQWARMHASANGAISPRRCIVLADSGTGHWRLWQLVRAETPLREIVERALAEPRTEHMLAKLARVARHLVDAEHVLAPLALALPAALDTLGLVDDIAVYIGLMPELDAAPVEPRPFAEPLMAVHQLLAPAIVPELARRGLDVDAALARIAHGPASLGVIDAAPDADLLGALDDIVEVEIADGPGDLDAYDALDILDTPLDPALDERATFN